MRLDPLSAETYADMGTAYLARRELLASQREYELALQLQPVNALAHANLVLSAVPLLLPRVFRVRRRACARCPAMPFVYRFRACLRLCRASG